MECHPWFEVSDRRKIRFRNVQIKVLLVFEQGRPLQVSTSFDNFDQFWPVSTSFNQFRPVSTSFDYSWLVYKSFDNIQDTIFLRGVITVADQCDNSVHHSVLRLDATRKKRFNGKLFKFKQFSIKKQFLLGKLFLPV